MICKPFHFHTVSELFTLLCEWTARDAAGGSWPWTDGLRKSSEKRGAGPRGGGLGVGALCAGCGSLGVCSGILSLEFVSGICGHRCRCAFIVVSHNPLSSQCNRENVKNTSS